MLKSSDHQAVSGLKRPPSPSSDEKSSRGSGPRKRHARNILGAESESQSRDDRYTETHGDHGGGHLMIVRAVREPRRPGLRPDRARDHVDCRMLIRSNDPAFRPEPPRVDLPHARERVTGREDQLIGFVQQGASIQLLIYRRHPGVVTQQRDRDIAIEQASLQFRRGSADDRRLEVAFPQNSSQGCGKNSLTGGGGGSDREASGPQLAKIVELLRQRLPAPPHALGALDHRFTRDRQTHAATVPSKQGKPRFEPRLPQLLRDRGDRVSELLGNARHRAVLDDREQQDRPIEARRNVHSLSLASLDLKHCGLA